MRCARRAATRGPCADGFGLGFTTEGGMNHGD